MKARSVLAAMLVLASAGQMSQGAQHDDHSQHAHGDHAAPAARSAPRTPIPVLTDEDRLAALPPSGGHPTHVRGLHGLLRFDRLETWRESGDMALGWEVQGWAGTDLTRLWLRSEGERADGSTSHAGVELLAGRSISTWWDVLAGIRHDFGTGAERDFLALGIAGLAPHWIEVNATAYLGNGGRTAARVEFEHDLLLTNRLVLQALLKGDLYGKDDPARGTASGLSSAGFALRLRYEITRRFAPYAGVQFERAFGATADLRRDASLAVSDTRLVLGVRTWF